METQHGIPSHDTFRRVFSLTHEDAFEQCFAAWTASRADAFEDEIVAIDGDATILRPKHRAVSAAHREDVTP